MKKLMKQLIQASYKDGVLDQETVERIAAKLTRTELKAYIRGLKEQEKRRTVYVEAPIELTEADRKEVASIFSKRVISRINPDLLIGIRITDNDDVYNMNLQSNLERIVTYAGE